MNLFRYECSKIWSKKIVLIGLLLLLAWFAFYFYVSNKDYECVSDGVVYHGMDAVAKDKEITKQFEGAMTFEKAQSIIDQYGFSVYENADETGYYRGGNYCSQWVTDYMTPYRETYSDTAEGLSFYSGDDAEIIKKYTAPGLYFSYQKGWENLTSCLDMMILLLNFIIVIAIANVFTEEYSLRTAPILLTTKKGKSQGIWMKVLSSITFSSTAYVAVCTVVILPFLWFYGTDGINSSAVFIGRLAPSAAGIFGSSVGAVLAEQLLLGLLSVIMSTCITLAVSATCRQPFTSILTGLCAFILPYIYVNYLAPLLPQNRFFQLLEQAARYFPLYLPVRVIGRCFPVALGIMLIVSSLTAFLSFSQYRNYQAVN